MRVLALALLVAAGCFGSASAQDTIKPRDADKIAKGIQEYFSYLQEEQYTKAGKEFAKIEKDVGKLAKIEEPLRLVSDWRVVLSKGSREKKSDIKLPSSGNFGIRPLELDSPLPAPDSAKAAFDGKLKVFASLPRDFKSKTYPVVVALHPIEAETGLAIKEMKTSKQLVKWAKEWAEDTYPKEFLESHIVLVPIMDMVVVSANGLTADRPNWDSDQGALWAATALTHIVLRNAPHDLSRIFFDGHGVGAKAAIQFCARFPGLQTGAVVRGTPPNEIHFVNCRGTAILFVGEEPKEFFETWSQEPGYRLQHADTADPATLAKFIADNEKQFCPEKVEIQTEHLRYGAAYWLTISDFDHTLETTEPAYAVAEVNREANEIIVTSNERVKQFVVYLNDELVDLDREIKILHKRATSEEDDESAPEVRFSGTKKRVLKDALSLAYSNAHGNVGEVYVSSVVVDL